MTFEEAKKKIAEGIEMERDMARGSRGDPTIYLARASALAWALEVLEKVEAADMTAATAQ